MPERLQNPSEFAPSPEEQERVKLAVCGFFQTKLAELEAAAADSPSGYVQQFYQLCTGSSDPWVRKKEFDFPGLPVPLRIRFDRNSGYQPKLAKMSINVEPLLMARTAGELKEAALSILESVYHEAEHIFFPVELEEYEGADRGITIEEAIRYASQDTEINAHARQFAFRYSVEYPNEPFALDKMQMLAERLKPKNAIAYSYFIAFARPATQEKYRHLADLTRVHDSIVVQTRNHLEKLRQAT